MSNACCDHLHHCGADQRHWHECCQHWHGIERRSFWRVLVEQLAGWRASQEQP